MIAINPSVSVAATNEISGAFERELHEHMPALAMISIRFERSQQPGRADLHGQGGHSYIHSPEAGSRVVSQKHSQ